MDVLGFFLMLVTDFLHTGSEESIREVVMVGRVGGEGHEKRPLAAFVTGLFGEFALGSLKGCLTRIDDARLN